MIQVMKKMMRYKHADFFERINMFLEYRDLRNVFKKIGRRCSAANEKSLKPDDNKMQEDTLYFYHPFSGQPRKYSYRMMDQDCD